MSLENYIEECIKELDHKCGNATWKLYVSGKKSNPKDCRDLLAQQLKQCVNIYQSIYQLCEKKVEFNEIRSVVGQIVSTSGYTVDKVVNQIEEFLKKYSCKGRLTE